MVTGEVMMVMVVGAEGRKLSRLVRRLRVSQKRIKINDYPEYFYVSLCCESIELIGHVRCHLEVADETLSLLLSFGGSCCTVNNEHQVAVGGAGLGGEDAFNGWLPSLSARHSRVHKCMKLKTY